MSWPTDRFIECHRIVNSTLTDTCHREHGDHDICQGDVQEDGLAPLLAQAVLAQHEVVQHKAVANHREDDET